MKRSNFFFLTHCHHLNICNYSSFNHTEPQSVSSEKTHQEAIPASSPSYQHPNDYSIMHESASVLPEVGNNNNNNNLVFKKTNWTTPLTEKIV